MRFDRLMPTASRCLVLVSWAMLTPKAPGAAAAPSAPASASLEQKNPGAGEATLPAGLYGSLDLRHHTNHFYKRSDEADHTTPSLHLRLQAGRLFYGGALDAYATVGVLKYAETQQVLSRRPELAVDFYPIRTPAFVLKLYQLVSLPQGNALAGEDEAAPGDGAGSLSLLQLAPGTTAYTIGIQPSLVYSLETLGGVWQAGASLEAFTHLYDRKQYLPSADQTLAVEGTEPRPSEDRALRLGSRQFLSLAYTPHALRPLTSTLGLVYDSKFQPHPPRVARATREETPYSATRSSYLRLRTQLRLSSRLTLLNDVYHFQDGFLAARRSGELRRYRNIIRLICSL